MAVTDGVAWGHWTARWMVAGLLMVTPVAAPVGTVLAAAETPGALETVGAEPLQGRGMNAALAVAGDCAFVGSRNDAAPLVVDVADPGHPRLAGMLHAHPGSTPRELRAIPRSHELAVMFYRLAGGLNGLDLYHWKSSCLAPELVGHYDFGNRTPHEFYTWEDPVNPSRVLAYVALFATPGESLEVLDLSLPARPLRVGVWAAPAAYRSAELHSIALSNDGRLAYLSMWQGGLAVADTSDFATGKDNPTLRLLTPPGGVYRTPPGNVHSAVPIPGRGLLVTTDERYPAPYGAGCPYGVAHLLDVSAPGRPVQVGTYAIAENSPALCATAGAATWTSHNPTLTADLAMVSWYSGGLQVFSTSDPAHPRAIAELRPSGVNPALRDLQLGGSDAMTWSYPVVSRGLIYVVDINQGLLVERYSGPFAEEVSGARLLQGNSNVLPEATAAASPSPTGGQATPAPIAMGSPGFSRNGALVAGALLVAAVAAAVRLRHRFHR
ncbi:MAG: LVIVD repeat-containing protein [Candidatus Dormibacteria bacterium]